MEAGLYDVLRGCFHDGTKLSETPESSWRMQSVLSNLTHLFNTRQGAIAHLPEYGLPDPSIVYRDSPDAIHVLQQSVRRAIERFEPRLQRVRVRHVDREDDVLRLTFVISARLASGQRVKLQTTFASDDLVQVSPWMR